jgi:hypothetical protein
MEEGNSKALPFGLTKMSLQGLDSIWSSLEKSSTMINLPKSGRFSDLGRFPDLGNFIGIGND